MTEYIMSRTVKEDNVPLKLVVEMLDKKYLKMNYEKFNEVSDKIDNFFNYDVNRYKK